jgi:hypothetical protein
MLLIDDPAAPDHADLEFSHNNAPFLMLILLANII